MPGIKQVEAVTASQPDRWMEILEEIGVYDFYHLPAYHRLAEIRGGGQAIMPVFRNGGHSMAFPLLVRDITFPGVASEGYHDAACVPGLTGPLVSNSELTEDIRHGLMQQFQDYLQQNRILSVYSRLHFMLDQEAFLTGYGEIHGEGVEVTVDLTVPPEERFRIYREVNRTDIRRLRNMGFTFEETGPECLEEFMGLYYATMDRVGANQRYYFERSYFEYLVNELGDSVKFFVCKHGEVTACAVLNLVCNGHIHCYLYGDAIEYHKSNLSKLLYDETINWGHRAGYQVLHLGGGKESLIHFKMGFGSSKHLSSTWRYVTDRAVYDDHCRSAFELAGKTPEDAYFPEYRSPSLNLEGR